MTKRATYDRITKCTLKGLGRAVNPHLFRDCSASTIALEDPHHVRIAARLLGHRTFSTTEEYYIQAGNIEASRIMQTHLLALRSGRNAPTKDPGS